MTSFVLQELLVLFSLNVQCRILLQNSKYTYKIFFTPCSSIYLCVSLSPSLSLALPSRLSFWVLSAINLFFYCTLHTLLATAALHVPNNNVCSTDDGNDHIRVFFFPTRSSLLIETLRAAILHVFLIVFVIVIILKKSCRDVYKFLFSYHLPPPPSPLLNNNNGETIIRVIGKGQVMLQREYSALARIFIKIQCNIINILIIRMIATYRIFSLCFPCCYTPLSGVSHVQIIITSITIVVLRMLHYY